MQIAKPKNEREKELLSQLLMLNQEIRRRESVGHPGHYGMPDLLFPKGFKPGYYATEEILDPSELSGCDLTDGWVREPLKNEETDEEYVERQNLALNKFITEHLFITKDGRKIYVRTIPQQLDFIADIFYRRTTKAILWKPRGGGGSLSAAVLIWILLVYRNVSVLDLAGSGDQAKIVYDYVKEFWDCLHPDTRVVTDRGLIPVCEVTESDSVLTEDGTYRRVLKVIEKEARKRECVRISPVGWGSGITVTVDHEILTTEGWKKAGTLTKKDKLYFPRIKQRYAMEAVVMEETWASEQHIQNVHRSSVHTDRLVVKNLKSLSRFVGYWLAEGCFEGGPYGICLTFGSHEERFVADCRRVVRDVFGVDGYVDLKGSVLRFRFSSRIGVKWLREQFGSGATNKKIPNWVICGLPDECLRELLIGMVRGDGWLSKKEGKIHTQAQYASASHALVVGIWQVLNRLGILGGVTRSPPKNSEIDGREICGKGQWHLKLSGNFARDLVGMCGEEFVVPKRNWNRISVFEGHYEVPVVKVEKLSYSGVVYDLSVDSVHSFASVNAVMHNCVPGLAAGLIDGDPLSQITRLVTGVEVKCVPSTEKQARGKHYSVIFVDEACLLPGTLVWTSRGFVPVEEVIVGDEVLNKDGKITKVKKVWSKGWSGEVVHVQPAGFKNGFTVTDDHRIFTAPVTRRYEGRGPETPENFGWVNAGELSENSWLFFPKAVRTDSSFSTPVPVTKDFCKWLGYWVGDGWTDKGRSRNIEVVFNKASPKLFVDEYQMLSKSLFDRKAFLYTDDFEQHENVEVCHFTHKELAEWLDENCGTTALEKRVPMPLLSSLSEEEIESFLVGYARSDGGVWEGLSSTGGRCRRLSFRTSSETLCSRVVYCLSRLGIVPSFRKRSGKWSVIRGKRYWSKESWVIDVNGEAMESLAEKIMPEWDRKQSYNKWKTVSGGMAVRIKKLEKSFYEGPVWDIEVEEGESFLLPNGVVHNCQDDPRPEKAMRAAIQGAMSEYDPVIVLLSTFHLPHGMFQEYWDDHEDRGFARYKWSCLDTMCACREGMENATDEDPESLDYCKTCFLTDKKMVKDISGQFDVETFTGCNGYARKTEGWMTFNQICEQKKLNLGTTIFECEFLCVRPQYSSSVYPPELIEQSLTDPLEINPETDRIAVGIDWGIQTAGSLAINMIARMVEYVYVAEIIYSDHKLVSDVADLLNGWREQFGSFPILADASHPFNNAELSNSGFDIRPISFGSWKKIGIENVSKFFVFNRLRINKNLDTLIDQLKRFRRNETTGNIVKKDDHGPDSLMVSMLNFRFEDEFGPDISKAAALTQQTRMLDQRQDLARIKDKVEFSDEGLASPITAYPGFIPEEARKKDTQKNILVF